MKKFTGATAIINLDTKLIQDAGIDILRFTFGFPLNEDGSYSDSFVRRLKAADNLLEQGFKIFGGTFGPGSYRYDEEKNGTVWTTVVPKWAGEVGSEKYYHNIERAGEVLGQECAKYCTYWQIANEPDVKIFHGELTKPQNMDFLISLARGIKKGDSKAQTGINIGFITDYARWLMPMLYDCENSVFDYIGIDGYMGSWQEGGPQSWIGYIDEVYGIIKKPIVINEWGYSTLHEGPDPDPENKRRYNQDVCRDKIWEYEWKGHHTPERQAEYILESMEIFAQHPAVIGELFFRWSDTINCWQCGDELCPAECAWGIVDTDGNPKPGYYALKEAYEKYFC